MDRSSSGDREMLVDPAAYSDADAGSSSGGEDSLSSSSDGGGEGSDLESLTGRGIKCLCSELLELKKSSNEGFHKNVYLNYPTFVRVFKEVGDVESELMELKRHVSDQERLVKDLTENFCLDNFSEDLLESKVEIDLEVGDHLLSKSRVHAISILEKLDILSLEQQFEEAVDILETENRTLQKIDGKGDLISAENVSSHRSALLEWRIALADQLAATAGHPRVTAPQLQKSLSLLCRLGESCRANSLLIAFYHSYVMNRMHDFQDSKLFPSQMYITELAKAVFSVISQAARSFVMLYGETSSYSSEFMMWVMEEIKMFTDYFDMYIKFICETDGGLYLAVEGMKCAFYFCSLLKPQRLDLHPYLMKSIWPCMEEVLQMHVDYLRKSISSFTTTDTWILGKFLISEITREKSSCVDDRCKLECCLLTNSGRKFITMVQATLEDISPLSGLQMETSILRVFSDLFNEYIEVLVCSIPSFGNPVEGPLSGSPAQTLSQQLALLVNSWTVVDYLFRTAKYIFEGIEAPNDETILENYEDSRLKELDGWFCSIQDAANQLRGSFCQKFVDSYISATARCIRTVSDLYLKSLDLSASSQVPMPSIEFQMLFQELQQLEKCCELVFCGADEKVEKLLEDLMNTASATIFDNIMFFRDNEHSSLRQSIWFKQFVLDMHFLVEIARFGGYLSDRLMEASRKLVVDVENEFLYTSVVTDHAWAAGAAKAAIQKLVETETNLEPDENHMIIFEDSFYHESAQPSSKHDVTVSVELCDSGNGSFAEADHKKSQKIEKPGVHCEFEAKVSDDKDSMSPSTYIDIEGIDDALRTRTWINKSE